MTASYKIVILLMQYPDAMATAMGRFTRFRYTHASIGLSEDLNTFYSFVHKGFIVEKITRYLKPEREPFPCALYEIEVPEKVYQNIKQLLQSYAARRSSLRYSRFSLILCLLGIPFKQKNSYFCSHFVAEVLQRAKAVQLPKNSVLCLPKDFHNLKETRMIFRGNLQEMVTQYHLYELA